MKLNIGLLGFGTVGKGVYDIIQENKQDWSSKYGCDVDVVCVATVTLNSDRHRSLAGGSAGVAPSCLGCAAVWCVVATLPWLARVCSSQARRSTNSSSSSSMRP